MRVTSFANVTVHQSDTGLLHGLAPQERRRPHLKECVVGSTQHSFCVLQTVHLVGSGLLAHLEVLEEPVTLRVQTGDVFHSCAQLFVRRGEVVSVALHCCLGVCLGQLLLRERLRICRSLFRRILHQCFVICLSILLFGSGLCHVLVQISDKKIDHLNDPSVGFRLLHEGTPRLWRRAWVRTRLGQRHRRRRRRRELWVVELLEPVLGQAQNLFRSGIGSNQLVKLLVLCLAIGSCFRHRFVQLLNTCCQCSDLFCQCCNCVCAQCQRLLQVADVALQGFLLVVGAIQLFRTIGLLVVVVDLFLLQIHYHSIDHGDDLLEPDLLPTQGQCHKIQPDALLACQA